MAKKSKIAKNDQRRVIVERWAAKRLELKKALVDPNGTEESREAARLGLQKLPRDASPVRLRNRDSIDGRPRGVLSRYGISRVRFRDMAHRGELPGITKSSWEHPLENPGPSQDRGSSRFLRMYATAADIPGNADVCC
jgi:small subunit ribosomal protein S14